MMKIYISGKMSGLSKAEYRAKFQRAEARLRRLGLEPVNPAKFILGRFFAWLIGYKLILKYDLHRLKKCDGIYMLNNWVASGGAQVEYRFAMQHQQLLLLESMDGKVIARRVKSHSRKLWLLASE